MLGTAGPWHYDKMKTLVVPVVADHEPSLSSVGVYHWTDV